MHDVIIGNYEIKVKGWKKGEPYIWFEEMGRQFPPLTGCQVFSKLEERNEKRKEKMRREKRKIIEKQKGKERKERRNKEKTVLREKREEKEKGGKGKGRFPGFRAVDARQFED